MSSKRLEILNGFLCLVDVILLILVYSHLHSVSNFEIIAILVFDALVSALVIYDFSGRLKKSKQGWRYILNNWFIIPIATPIFIFVLPEAIFTGAPLAGATLGIMFRALGILYLVRLVVKDDLNVLGTSKTLHVLMTFYVMLGVIALLFYDAERWSTHSSIKTIGDSFWYVIQMASGSTFGPSPVTYEGRIAGAIAMIVGSTLTGLYVSIITVWYITRKMIGNKGDLSHETKQMIISKINGLENLSSKDLKQLLLLIESLHENLQKSRNG
jgi:hypothetical protein